MDCGGCYQSEIAAGDSVAKSKCYRYYVCPRWMLRDAMLVAVRISLCSAAYFYFLIFGIIRIIEKLTKVSYFVRSIGSKR